MKYVYNGKIYEVDYIQRNLQDEPEIFLIDEETREFLSITELTEDAQDDLNIAINDLMSEVGNYTMKKFLEDC